MHKLQAKTRTTLEYITTNKISKPKDGSKSARIYIPTDVIGLDTTHVDLYIDRSNQMIIIRPVNKRRLGI